MSTLVGGPMAGGMVPAGGREAQMGGVRGPGNEAGGGVEGLTKMWLMGRAQMPILGVKMNLVRRPGQGRGRKGIRLWR